MIQSSCLHLDSVNRYIKHLRNSDRNLVLPAILSPGHFAPTAEDRRKWLWDRLINSTIIHSNNSGALKLFCLQIIRRNLGKYRFIYVQNLLYHVFVELAWLSDKLCKHTALKMKFLDEQVGKVFITSHLLLFVIIIKQTTKI